MPMGDPGGHFADTGGYGSFNQGGGGFQTGGALNGGRGEYGLAGDRSFNSGNVGAYSQNALGNNFGNPIYSNPIPAAKRVNPITQQVVNPNPYTSPPVAPTPVWQAQADAWPGGTSGGNYVGYGPTGGTGGNGYNGGDWNNVDNGWANGGMIRPGQSGWVGERGPEFAQGLPGGGVAITPNHMLGNPPPRPMGPPMTYPPAPQPGMGQMPPMGGMGMGGGGRGFGPAPGQGQGGGFRGMLGY